jgi:NADH-quinone oxidoreductase subunit C
MNAQEIVAALRGRFGEKILDAFEEDKHPRVHVEAADAREVLQFLRREPSLKMDWLRCLSGVDYVGEGRMAVVYDLWSFEHRHVLAVKVFCSREEARVPSVVDLWAAANWHEREAFDLFGIVFDGHPDLRRILCADDWVGHPLRKDYVFPREYHGIPGSVELDWQQKADYPK